MKQFLFIGLFGAAVAAAALGLNYFSGDEPTPKKEVADARPVAPVAPNRVARGSGIPVPAPPPVAAYRPGAPAPKAGLKSVARLTEPAKTAELAKTTEPVQPLAHGAGDAPTSVASTQEKTVARALQSPAAPAARPIAPKSVTPAAKMLAPTFDVVRINLAGDAIIVGRAAPGATGEIYGGERLIGSVVADGRGDWVFLSATPLASGKRELSLSVRDAQGVETRSRSVVVLMVPDRAPKTALAAPKKNKAELLAVLVSRDGLTPSQVLQRPPERLGVGGPNLSIGIVDYDEKGNVKIGGKGQSGVGVQVYVDNRLVGRSRVGPKGDWTVGPRNKVAPGIHTLRVDASRKGKVVARVEIPFFRADPATVKANEALVVVQPGNSLWRIARRTLGKGIQYVEIYKANQSKIVNPDLIYPGQMFLLPKTY